MSKIWNGAFIWVFYAKCIWEIDDLIIAVKQLTHSRICRRKWNCYSYVLGRRLRRTTLTGRRPVCKKPQALYIEKRWKRSIEYSRTCFFFFYITDDFEGVFSHGRAKLFSTGRIGFIVELSIRCEIYTIHLLGYKSFRIMFLKNTVHIHMGDINNTLSSVRKWNCVRTKIISLLQIW